MVHGTYLLPTVYGPWPSKNHFWAHKNNERTWPPRTHIMHRTEYICFNTCHTRANNVDDFRMVSDSFMHIACPARWLANEWIRRDELNREHQIQTVRNCINGLNKEDEKRRRKGMKKKIRKLKKIKKKTICIYHLLKWAQKMNKPSEEQNTYIYVGFAAHLPWDMNH